VGVRTEIVPSVQSSLALWRLDIDSELGVTPATPGRRNLHRLAALGIGVEKPAGGRSAGSLVDLDVAWSHARFTTPDPDPAVTGDHIPGAIGTAVSAARRDPRPRS